MKDQHEVQLEEHVNEVTENSDLTKEPARLRILTKVKLFQI